MRYRQLDPNGDYLVGAKAVFLTNSPQAVAQAIQTRLGLQAGEWFLDATQGLDWKKITGSVSQNSADLEIKSVILGTPGVVQILSYQSLLSGRNLTVSAIVQTLYGAIPYTGTFQ